MSKIINTQLAASLSLLGEPDGSDNDQIVAVRAGRAYIRVTRKNAAAVAKRVRTAHLTFPRGGYKRAKADRHFPTFKPGMSTVEYLALFADANKNHDVHVLPYDYKTMPLTPSPVYEGGALDFDAIEELNEDYIELTQTLDCGDCSTPTATVAIAAPQPETSAAAPKLRVVFHETGLEIRQANEITRNLRNKIDAAYTDTTARAAAYQGEAARLQAASSSMGERAGCKQIAAAYAIAADIFQAWTDHLQSTLPCGDCRAPTPAPTVAIATPPPVPTQPAEPAIEFTPRILQPRHGQRVASKSGHWEAWLYKSHGTGKQCMVIYQGKSAKPWHRYSFKNRSAALKSLAYYASEAERIAATAAQRAAERRSNLAKPHTLKVGDVLESSWGYDQTNIDYYQITQVIGKRTVEVREIGRQSQDTGWLTGRCVPAPGEFTGAPMRKQVDVHGDVNVLSAAYGRARKIEPTATIAGVNCYPSRAWSAYA